MDQNENQQYADTTAVNTAGSIPPAMQMAGGGSAGSVQKPVQSQTQNRPQNPLQSSQNPVRDRQAMVQGALSNIQREQPVEQIYKMLNQEMAVAVVISAGFYKGKTLGQLALEKPQSLTGMSMIIRGRIICFVQRQNTFWMRHRTQHKPYGKLRSSLSYTGCF